MPLRSRCFQMKTRHPERIAAGVVLAMLAVAARAQDHALPEVEVTASPLLPGLNIEAARLPYPVQHADVGKLEQGRPGGVVAALRDRLSGVNVNDIQGGPFQRDLTYRGFRASPVLGASQGISVYLDGVRINEPFGDVVNWDMLPEAALADVSLVPGSNPLFGLNTLGGALAFTTRSGRSDPGFDATLSLGSHGLLRTDFGYGKRFPHGWHGFVAGTWLRDDGWREHGDGRLGNLFAKLGRHRGATQWDLSLLLGDSRIHGTGLLPSYPQPDGALRESLYRISRSAAYTYPDLTENRLQHIAYRLRHRPGTDMELGVTAYLRSSRRNELNADVSDPYSDYAQDCGAGFEAGGAPLDPASCSYTRATGLALPSAVLNRSRTSQHAGGVHLTLTRYLVRHQWTLGADADGSHVSYEQTTQDGSFTADRQGVAIPGATQQLSSSVSGGSTALSAYATDTWTLRKGTDLTAAARFNHVTVHNTLTTAEGAQPGERFSYDALNPGLGITHRLGRGLSLFGNVSRSNRVPTAIELGCADPAQPCRLPAGLQSDPYLKQVISQTVEAGLRWHSRHYGSATLSVYRTENRDDILFLAAGTSQQGYFSNFARTLRQGLDLTVDGRLGHFDPYLSYSYLHAVYDADGTLFMGSRNVQVTPGTPIAGLPRHTLKLGLDWKPDARFTLGAGMLAVSSLSSQGNEDGLRSGGGGAAPADWHIPGYTLFDLHASHRDARKRWETFARIENLFDRDYETYGLVGTDLFPNGALSQPAVTSGGPAGALFVAPGAPRTVVVGVRYRM